MRKFVVTVGIAALVAAGVGAAHAQTSAGCNQMLLLLTSGEAALKDMRGAKTEEGKDDITYASKVQVVGFKGCTIASSVDNSKSLSNGYNEHHLSCGGDFADSETATKYVEILYACVKDMMGARETTEQRIGGAYRMTGIDVKAYMGGKDTPYTFNETGFVRLWVEKGYATSTNVNLNMYFYYPKPKSPPKQ